MGAPIKGELGLGDMLGLGFGVVADWTPGAAVTLFTSPSGVGGAVLTKVVARSPTGTQPLSFTVKVNGQTWGATVSLTGIGSGLVLPLIQPSATVQAYAAPAQTITVTPLAASAGALSFDLLGYYF